MNEFLKDDRRFLPCGGWEPSVCFRMADFRIHGVFCISRYRRNDFGAAGNGWGGQTGGLCVGGARGDSGVLAGVFPGVVFRGVPKTASGRREMSVTGKIAEKISVGVWKVY